MDYNIGSCKESPNVRAMSREGHRAIETERRDALTQCHGVPRLQTEESASHHEKARVRARARHLCRRVDKDVDPFPPLQSGHHHDQGRGVGNPEFCTDLAGARGSPRWHEPVPDDLDSAARTPDLAKGIRYKLRARECARGRER